MREADLPLLRCPVTGSSLTLADAAYDDVDIVSGTLVSEHGATYPIVRHVPRFVQHQSYADSFGLQWNTFRRTQLDSNSGLPISRERFYAFSGWQPEELEGKRVLDVGCGAGRFTEIALSAGAEVVALDYSSAVDACWSNHGPHPRLTVVQADMMQPPLQRDTFDFIYCFGVLQHTPDPRAAFLALPRLLRNGGRIAVDVYPKLLLNVLWPKYWLRPFTKRMDRRRLFGWVQRTGPLMLEVSRGLSRVPVIGSKLKYAVPVANYEQVYPLSSEQLREWAILDTFDMLSPTHDHPQSARTLRSWFAEAGLTDVFIDRPGFLIGRGTRGSHEPAAVAARVSS